MATEKELSDFLEGADRRAYKRTLYAVHDEDAALDIVQDTMIRLATRYADRPAAELPLLFARILSNATMDWFRRRKVRVGVVQNFSDLEPSNAGPDFDLLDTLETIETSWGARGPADHLMREQTLARHRRCGGRTGPASTRSLSVALLGRTGCSGNGVGHGLLGGQCKNPLRAGREGAGHRLGRQGNEAMNLNSRTRSIEFESLQARIGLRLAARLSEGNRRLPGDIGERLRVAREQALRQSRTATRASPVPALALSGGRHGATATASGPHTPWWLRLASATPLLLLLVGLLSIQHIHEQAQIRAAAELDAALLADDLPPDAYRDPGFVEFLKQRRQ